MMGRAVLLVVLALVTAGGMLGSATAGAPNVLVSVSTSGVQGDGDSQAPSVSADGSRVAFGSTATNLVTGDTNGSPDAFVRDLEEGWTRRVSVKSGREQTEGISVSRPVISGDGRWVAFVSYDDTIVRGDDNGGLPDVFLHDLRAGTTVLVSKKRSGGTDPGGGANGPAISFDGRFVSFVSYGRLIPADHNYEADVYVWDRVKDAMRIASLTDYGTPANDHNDDASISADGGCVAFRSYATNLDPRYTYQGTDIFVRDMVNGGTDRVSVPNEGASGGANSFGTGLSGKGTQVLFGSNDALVANHDGYTPDIYRRNLQRDHTSVVTATADGGRAGGRGTSISADGRYAAVQLVDFEADDTFTWDIVVRDLQQDTNRSVLSAVDGGAPNSYFDNPEISLWANAVVFDSAASNLVALDNNEKIDVFLRRVSLDAERPPLGTRSGCGEGLKPRRRPTCNGEKADWIGTRRPERIEGTQWSESHHAGGSNDAVLAGSGRDQLCGNAGDDLLDAGRGDDVLVGGDGSDFLEGSDGRDVCHGGPGKDEAAGCEVTYDIP